MTLQEVELMTADTSEENLSTNRDEESHICVSFIGVTILFIIEN